MELNLNLFQAKRVDCLIQEKLERGRGVLQKPEEEEQSGQGEPRKPSHRANPAASLSISVPPSTSTGLPSALSSLLEAILALAAL